MKTTKQLERRIMELELANERLRSANKNQADNLDFILSHMNNEQWKIILDDVTNLMMRVGLQAGLCEGRPDSKKSTGIMNMLR